MESNSTEVSAAGRTKTRRRPAAIGFALFGIAYVFLVFYLMDDWLRKAQAIVVGAVNIAGAIYLSLPANRDGREKDPNRAARGHSAFTPPRHADPHRAPSSSQDKPSL